MNHNANFLTLATLDNYLPVSKLHYEVEVKLTPPGTVWACPSCEEKMLREEGLMLHTWNRHVQCGGFNRLELAWFRVGVGLSAEGV